MPVIPSLISRITRSFHSLVILFRGDQKEKALLPPGRELRAFIILSFMQASLQHSEWKKPFRFAERLFLLSGWQDSNLRPSGPKPDALTGLRYTPNMEAQKYYKFSYFIVYLKQFDLFLCLNCGLYYLNLNLNYSKIYIFSFVRLSYLHSWHPDI